jgi:hypothetical protein
MTRNETAVLVDFRRAWGSALRSREISPARAGVECHSPSEISNLGRTWVRARAREEGGTGCVVATARGAVAVVDQVQGSNVLA